MQVLSPAVGTVEVDHVVEADTDAQWWRAVEQESDTQMPTPDDDAALDLYMETGFLD